MVSLIEQLQRDAADPQVPVLTLLRRAKIAAGKLELARLEKWMEYEIKGYPSKVSLPKFRKLSGQLRGWNPYNGWIPIHGDDPETMKVFTEFPCYDSVGQIEEIVRRSKDGIAQVQFGSEKLALLNRLMSIPLPRIQLTLSITLLTKILDEVRDAILDWSINLERAGVVGAEFSFSNEDKQTARGSEMTLNVGTIGSIVGNIGSHNTAGNITTGTIDVAGITNLTKQVRQHANELSKAGADAAETGRLSDELERELNKPVPDRSLIQRLLTDLRNTVSGAAGNLIASGILFEIGKLLG